MWQTQSVEPVRTAHISVLQTVNIVSHSPAQSSSDNIPSYPPDNILGSCCLAEVRGDKLWQTYQMQSFQSYQVESSHIQLVEI